MTAATVRCVGDGQIEDAQPRGTAIVRPLRHVRAVREYHARRFSDPAEAAVSRSIRAWAWALGESATAPVTDRQTAVPPSRSDIETEIAVADKRRLRGDRENRADAAAKVLRWLIGEDDRIPVRGDERGELVGGFGDVVRSPEQIGAILALAVVGRERAEAQDLDVNADPDDRRFARRDVDYLDGVAATLGWVLGKRARAPISPSRSGERTTGDLKRERVHAEDAIERGTHPWMVDRVPPRWYGEGVKFSITWLLGDSTAPPVDEIGRGSYTEGRKPASQQAPPHRNRAVSHLSPQTGRQAAVPTQE